MIAKKKRQEIKQEKIKTQTTNINSTNVFTLSLFYKIDLKNERIFVNLNNKELKITELTTGEKIILWLILWTRFWKNKPKNEKKKVNYFIR